jgi:hypothetical protein
MYVLDELASILRFRVVEASHVKNKVKYFVSELEVDKALYHEVYLSEFRLRRAYCIALLEISMPVTVKPCLAR